VLEDNRLALVMANRIFAQFSYCFTKLSISANELKLMSFSNKTDWGRALLDSEAVAIISNKKLG